jgi:hypothetical protein
MEAGIRGVMEQRLGHYFGAVRIHADADAAASAATIQARAYTYGRHVVMGAGQYQPHTRSGQALLTHELTHVVQQSGSAQTGPPSTISSPHDPAERQAAGAAETAGAGAGRQVHSPHEALPVVQRQAPPPAPDTEDCSPAQAVTVLGHIGAARIWVDDAARKVRDYAFAYADPRHSAAPRSPAEAAVVRQALQDNFHTTAPDAVLQIRDGFNSLRSGLNDSFTVECEDDDCDDRAYVRGRFAFIRRHANIHVCPPWYTQDYFNRVRTLIHERAHQYPGASDNAYNWSSDYATLSPDDAIDNADSYAVAARQIYHGGAHGPGT